MYSKKILGDAYGAELMHTPKHDIDQEENADGIENVEIDQCRDDDVSGDDNDDDTTIRYADEISIVVNTIFF